MYNRCFLAIVSLFFLASCAMSTTFKDAVFFSLCPETYASLHPRTICVVVVVVVCPHHMGLVLSDRIRSITRVQTPELRVSTA